MRKLKRLDLDHKTAQNLKIRQAKADTKREASTLDTIKEWENARKTVPLGNVLSVLKSMAGGEERCMYCNGHEATDIEHFWPKSKYPERMFSWPNLLLNCTVCGRKKLDKFPMSAAGPLLIDPTVDEPWQHLNFNSKNGAIGPRYDLAAGKFSAKGAATVETLEFDRREALQRVYLKSFARLSERVSRFLEQGEPAPEILTTTLLNDDDHGLLGWCVIGDGWKTPPFTTLRQNYPEVWDSLERAVREN